MKIATGVPAFLVLALASCGGGSRVYPDTDIVELKDFGPPKIATGVQIDRGTMQSGTLEYGCQGELVAVFRAYILAMKDHGWHSRAEEVTGDKAVATLMKDTRTCSLQFTQTQGTIRAVVKVSSAK